MFGSTATEEYEAIICENCLGDNPYIRMTKEPLAAACKMCDRPFTVYRYKGGRKSRYKKTNICPSCSKIKNCCQTCLKDLVYGMPTYLRDSGMEAHARMPVAESEVMKDWVAEQMEKKMATAGMAADYGKLTKESMLSDIQKTQPYANFRAKIWTKEDKLRGSKKPKGQPAPPKDVSVTTLCLIGIDDRFQQRDIKEKFEPFGPIESISLIPDRGVGFVKFETRQHAETAADKLWNDCILYGSRLRIQWKKGSRTASFLQAQDAAENADKNLAQVAPPPGMAAPPGMAPPPGMMKPLPTRSAMPAPPGMGQAQYQSSSASYGTTQDPVYGH